MSKKTGLYYFTGNENTEESKKWGFRKGATYIIHKEQELFEVGIIAHIELKDGRVLKLPYKNFGEFAFNWKMKMQ